MSLAPIVLFVYNRLDHTQKTIEALQKNFLAGDSHLYIYSDCYKSSDDMQAVQEVRQYIHKVNGFRKVTVIERSHNLGLANSIIDGVSFIINKYGKIIVLEDDLVTNPYFLTYMNDALERYQNDFKIFVISGYSPPIIMPKSYTHDVYLTHRSSSWGWATWAGEWNSVVWENTFYSTYSSNSKVMKAFSNKGGSDRPRMLKRQIKGKIDSWAIRRAFTQFLQNKYTVYPVKSLVHNIGHDGSGVHCGYNQRLMKQDLPDVVFKTISLPSDLQEDLEISLLINKYHSKSLIYKVYDKLLSVFKND